MRPSDQIRNTSGGRICPRCSRAYPSLYWFKRDVSSGGALCLECAKEAASGSLQDVMPTRKAEAEETPQPRGSGIEALIEAVALTVWEQKREELLQAAGELDAWLLEDPLRIVSSAAALLLAARLAWLAFHYARSQWWKLRKPPGGRSGASSP